jgi:GNAT superfamily N-acetyltransferase
MNSSTPHPEFRQLSTNELGLGYSVYLSAFEWLNAHGIRQWLVPLPRSVYTTRQERGENYGLFVADQLVVIVSLGPDTPPEWAEVLTESETWWIHTLAIKSDYHGRGLGALTLQHSLAYLKAQGLSKIYLDCLAGFLPTYYARLGFTQLSAKNHTYPSGNTTFPIVLMKKDLRDA